MHHLHCIVERFYMEKPHALRPYLVSPPCRAALAFLPSPARAPAFAPFFTREWRSALEASTRNLLAQVRGWPVS